MLRFPCFIAVGEVSTVDAKELRQLIELISKSDFAAFELERDGFKLKLERSSKQEGAPQIVHAAPLPAPQPQPTATSQAPPAPAAAPPAQTTSAPAAGGAATPAPESDLAELKSPIVGTYYDSPSPDANPYVSVGDRVRKGQVMCIVEAMKLMNEIEAEADGEVVEILVKNAQPVEYGETLFRLRPL